MQIASRRLTSSILYPLFRKEIFEASNLAFLSNNQWCWCSSSAAVCSDSFTQKQRGKKLTKQERSVLVLAFVEKYMASNGGKFPTVHCTQKQVGGSFYSIRLIIQELEFHHKRASLETQKEVKVRAENDKSEVFALTAEPCILSDSNHKTASSETKKEVKIKEENDKSEVFPLTVEPCTSADTDQRTASLEIKKEVKISKEIDKCEDFPSTAEHRILVDTKQASFKEHVEDAAKIRKHPSNLGFDNLQSSSPSAMATVKPQTHTSSGISVNAENPVSAEFKTETIIFCTPTEEGEVLEKDAASATNLQGENCPDEKKMNNQELYHNRRERSEHKTAAATNGSSFWGNLKSMAFGIINLLKK